jgi:hypothetical protein
VVPFSSSFGGFYFSSASTPGTLCLARKACSLVVVAGVVPAVEEERGREEREETRLSRDRVSPTPGTQHRPVWGRHGPDIYVDTKPLNVVFAGV